MNIRIGNDIRMNLKFDGPYDFTKENIKSFKCYLINTALECGDCSCDKCDMPKRFPREPFPQYYTPTPYALHTCGKPMYHAYPRNSKFAYDDFGGYFHDYHWWPGYNGFGVEPRGFFPGRPFWGCREWWKHRCYDIVPFNCKDFRYTASYTIDGDNRATAYFPAEDQFMCGTYKLVVVISTYEHGWGEKNVHTFTIDYGEVFTLVDTSDGVSGDVTIDVSVNQTGEVMGYIGFSTATTADDLNFDDLQYYDNIYGSHSLSVDESNNYLWICSKDPIHGVTTSGAFYVPLEDPAVKNTYYCYRCPNALAPNSSFNINIR